MNKKAIEELTKFWNGFQVWKNAESGIAKSYSDKYYNLRDFCIKFDILTIEEVREIEKNVKL